MSTSFQTFALFNCFCEPLRNSFGRLFFLWRRDEWHHGIGEDVAPGVDPGAGFDVDVGAPPPLSFHSVGSSVIQIGNIFFCSRIACSAAKDSAEPSNLLGSARPGCQIHCFASLATFAGVEWWVNFGYGLSSPTHPSKPWVTASDGTRRNPRTDADSTGAGRW